MVRVYAGGYIPEQLQGTKRVPEQIIGYELEIFSYTNLFWHPRRHSYVVPGGMLRQIFRADIGDLVANFVLSVSPQEGFNYAEGKARFPSKKSRKDKDFLLPVELREAEQYVRFIFVAHKQEFIYNFKLKNDIISVEQPLEYRITQYRSIDGKMKERETERVAPWFRKIKGENLPDLSKCTMVVTQEVTDPEAN